MLRRGWTLGPRLDNLLDQDYELVETDNVARRGLYASLAYGY